jgi:hypothetical protein
VVAVSFVLEGVSFLRSVRQAKPAARLMERDLIEQVMATSDPTLRAVFAEDSAALIGPVIAAAGLGAHQLTESPGPDAVGSILVGLLLAAVAIYPIDRNRELLVGEQADPRIRAAVVRALLKEPEVARVTYLRLEIVGPRIVAVIGDVDLVGDDTESHVAVRLRALEAKIAHRRWRALCSACRRPTNRRWPCDHPLQLAEIRARSAAGRITRSSGGRRVTASPSAPAWTVVWAEDMPLDCRHEARMHGVLAPSSTWEREAGVD